MKKKKREAENRKPPPMNQQPNTGLVCYHVFRMSPLIPLVIGHTIIKSPQHINKFIIPQANSKEIYILVKLNENEKNGIVK